MDTSRARDRARAQLVHSSSEESFEHIDPEFDDSYYHELRGVAVADYIPLETDEIILRRGTGSCNLACVSSVHVAS